MQATGSITTSWKSIQVSGPWVLQWGTAAHNVLCFQCWLFAWVTGLVPSAIHAQHYQQRLLIDCAWPSTCSSQLLSSYTLPTCIHLQATMTEQLEVAMLLGGGLSAAGFVRVYVTNGSLLNAFAISVSLLAIVFASVLLGTGLPFVLARGGVDPAHAGTSIQVRAARLCTARHSGAGRAGWGRCAW